MISYISGKIVKVNIGKDCYIDILISSGLGYRVFVTSQFSFPPKDSNVSIYTSFQVREDSQMLYGFDTEEKRDFFEKLLNVSGIGPKSALSVLSTYEMDKVKKIILDGDAKALKKVPGLGLKGSQKVILELRGKIDFDQDGEDKGDSRIKELKDALRSLGFQGKELSGRIDKGEALLKEEDIEIEILIKKVLQQ